MKSLFINIVILLLLALSVSAIARTNAQGRFTNADYEHFSEMATGELYKKAADYIQRDNVADSALLCYTIILNRYDFENLPDSLSSYISASLINLSYLYQSKYYDYARAYEYLLRALEVADKYKSDYDKPYIYLGMASVLQYIASDGSSLPSPLALVSKALDCAIVNNDAHTVAISAINLCDLAFERGEPAIISDEISKTEDYFRNRPEVRDSLFAPYLNIYKSVCAGDYDKAIISLDKVSEMGFSDMSFAEKYHSFASQQKVGVLKMAGRHDDAIEELKDLLEKSQCNNFQEFTLFALRELFELYSRMGNQDMAREYEYRYLHLNDSINKTSNLVRVKDVAFDHDISHARRDVSRLTTEKKLHLIIILAVSLIALLAATLLIYHIRTKRKLKEANLVLYNRVQELLNSNDNRQISIPEINSENDTAKEDVAIRLADERERAIYAKVLSILDSSQEIFSPDFSIKMLADMVGEPYYDVSAAINNCSGTNFKALLLNYRIREACRRLSDEANYGNQTMEAIAMSLGFKSRTYFNAVFKKETGLTPTMYMGIAREKNNNQDSEVEMK